MGIAFVFVAIFALMGLLLAATPWLMKKQECFAVTVPEFAQNDTRLRMFKHRYAAVMLIVTIANCVIVGAALLLGAPSAEVRLLRLVFRRRLLLCRQAVPFWFGFL